MYYILYLLLSDFVGGRSTYPCGYPWECDEDFNYTHAHFARITSACACASVKGAGKVNMPVTEELMTYPVSLVHL